MDLVVELARGDEAEALVGLRDGIAEWLTRRGIDQWSPGGFPPERMRAWIDLQAVHVLRRHGRPIAAAAVLWEDPDAWDDDPRAGYVHLLMVDRDHAGRGLGDRMLTHAEQEIRRHGRSRVRLDAVASNRRLVTWYRDRGYEPVGTRTFPDSAWHDCTLLEKQVAGPT